MRVDSACIINNFSALYKINKGNNNLKRTAKYPYPSCGTDTMQKYPVFFTGGKKPVPLYSIDKNGTVERFESRAEAAKKYGIEASGISRCISNGLKTAGGYVFIKAETVETTDENGNITRDEEKLGKIIEQAVELCSNAHSAKQTRIYAIAQDGSYRIFENATEAAKEYRVNSSSISECLNGKKKPRANMFLSKLKP